MPPTLAPDLPATLQAFIRESCHLPPDAFQPLSRGRVPEPAHRLLVHTQDMTSTLAAFHESPLRVEILQSRVVSDFYLREVFLRTTATDAIVEYGVIAIALDPFTSDQQHAITSGQAPLGALLHRFKIPFTSSPIAFFSISAVALAATPLRALATTTCHGRFNRLTQPTGAPLAWILEILPPLTSP